MATKAKHVLNVSNRVVNGTAEARRVRALGLIPAVVYSKGATGKTISVKAPEWEALSQHEFNLVTLQFEGGESMRVLLKETQRNFIKGVTSHIDFLEVRKDVMIEAELPLHPGFEAPLGCSRGGLLEQVLHTLKVECLPDDLPEEIVVDVAALEVGGAVLVKDIVLPKGVKAKGHTDLVAFHVIDANAMADETAAAGEASANEPEVVGAKKVAERQEAKKK